MHSYREAAHHDQSYGLASNNLAVTLAHLGKRDEALSAFRQAMQAQPGLETPLLNLGKLLFSCGRLKAAAQTYRQILERNGSSAAAWNGLGLVMAEMGRHDDARNAFVRAVESKADSAEAHYNLSFSLSALGDYDAALRAVTRAQSIDPYYVPQKYQLAIELQLQDPSITVVPEISADVSTDGTPDFDFDPRLLEDVFAELTASADATQGRAQMKRLATILGLVSLAALLAAPNAEARNPIRNAFFNVYPSATGTQLDDLPSNRGHCGICHYDFGGSDARNPYGLAVEVARNSGMYADDEAAIQSLENLDSDGDGYLNITEITSLLYSNTPTFPGLTAADSGLVINVTWSDVSPYVTPFGATDTTPPTVTVFTPNGGESFNAETTTGVTWTATADPSGATK